MDWLPSVKLWSQVGVLLTSIPAVIWHIQQTQKEAKRLRELGASVHPTLLEGWRWSQPHSSVDLTLKGDAGRSVIEIPSDTDGTEWAGLLFGALVAIGGLALALASVLQHLSFSGALIIFAVTSAVGYGLLWLNSKLIAVELTPENARLIVRYGVFFRRSYRYSRAQLANRKIHFREQSVGAMYTGQDRVWTYLVIEGVSSQRFIVPAPPVTVSWITHGLHAWCRQPVTAPPVVA